MLKLIRWLKGFVSVGFFGDIAERILNICNKNGIILWNIKPGKNEIGADMYADDFKRMRPALHGSNIKAKIKSKHGLPFIVNRYKKRLGFAVGLVISLIFLQFMSGYIWVIDVVGNDKVSADTIVRNCQKIGIYEGCAAGEIDVKNARERLLLMTDGLAWASLNIEGSHLTVNVSEIKNGDSKKAPSNLIAGFDGRIEKVNIKSGDCLVKPGDVVTKGDLLVSGSIENESGIKSVRSNGSIIASTKRIINISADFVTNKTEETGKTKSRSVLEFFNVKIPLFLGGEYKENISDMTVWQARLFGKKLPIKCYTKKYKYTKTVTKTVTEEELKSKLQNEIEQMISPDGEITGIEFAVGDGSVTARAEVSETKEITVEESINQ